MSKGAGLAGEAIELSYDDWKRFFNVDIAGVAVRASRLLSLVELLRSAASPTAAVKIVAGVIGRNTVGHSRDIQKCFREFLGIECLGCRELVKRISVGVPLAQVSAYAKLSFKEAEWLNSLRVLEKFLRESLKIAAGIELRDEHLKAMATKDYAALTGDPLGVFSMLRGFYVASRRILPHFSPHAFLIQTLRGVPRFALERLVGKEGLEVLSRFRMSFRELIPCENSDYSLLSHSAGTPGDFISSSIDLVFRLHELGSSYRLKHLRVKNEKEVFLDKATLAVDRVAEWLSVKREFSTLSKLLLSGGRIVERLTTLQIVKVRIEAGKPARRVSIGGRELEVGEFMKGLSPYSVLGLSRFENLVDRGASIEAGLLVYLRSR
ncbi:MAG: hypothetical protein RMH84_06255 [Sulfolobales archaeon]|nr:hypothetical protein [Sulfolobales archaeon]MCX8208919.1 hypothetical protein [Sulfolobales archaeon]MDW8011173.1 hypothetical protein [Sulfolobales archaeon]